MTKETMKRATVFRSGIRRAPVISSTRNIGNPVETKRNKAPPKVWNISWGCRSAGFTRSWTMAPLLTLGPILVQALRKPEITPNENIGHHSRQTHTGNRSCIDVNCSQRDHYMPPPRHTSPGAIPHRAQTPACTGIPQSQGFKYVSELVTGFILPPPVEPLDCVFKDNCRQTCHRSAEFRQTGFCLDG